ncbi:MAG: MmcQ/YjbR family DNA-binding protein [Agrococcus casei]|uniref:MmcQ/YjbR family DNA-binding protein n=1 Tax=Agrococcus casei TaxID=343512 RepID=UPI003F91F03F
MDTTIQELAAARGLELPGAELTHPFGPEWDVYKVRGKVFMLQTALGDAPMVTLKASPRDSEALRAGYPQITPGYHMNKRHWVTLHPGSGLDRQMVNDLVTESYLLVIEKNVPKVAWPVDPETFGHAAAG